MAHDCNDKICTSRREMVKAGLGMATWGLFGLSLPTTLFMREAYGVAPDPTTKKYDAIISCFMTGGPSQTDTWDPKSDPVASGYHSPNNVFPTLSLGKNDIYGKPIWLTNNLTNLANLVNSNPSAYGLGIIRSMHHGNGVHAIAESFMNCFWQSPVGNLYPSTSASMTYLMQDQVAGATGLPSCSIVNNQGSQFNDAKGSACPTALQVSGGSAGQLTATQAMLSLPTGVAQPQYDRRKAIIQAIEQNYDATRPDQNVKAWTAAWNQAHDITLQGKAAAAFNVPASLTTQLQAAAPSASASDMFNVALAQTLVQNGIPYVSMAIGGNDTHTNNRAGVTKNWGNTVDPLFSQVAKNLNAAGKRVLCVFIGDFGRTPASVASGRDGRDHWPSGFSAGLLSIGQPAFKTNAVGDTGPDGVWTATSSTPLKDLVYPGALGGLLYRAMGYPPTNPAYNVPNTTGVGGSMGPPVDPQYQDGANGHMMWLANAFGI